jgi:hypothetical protein
MGFSDLQFVYCSGKEKEQSSQSAMEQVSELTSGTRSVNRKHSLKREQLQNGRRNSRKSCAKKFLGLSLAAPQVR